MLKTRAAAVAASRADTVAAKFNADARTVRAAALDAAYAFALHAEEEARNARSSASDAINILEEIEYDCEANVYGRIFSVACDAFDVALDDARIARVAASDRSAVTRGYDVRTRSTAWIVFDTVDRQFVYGIARVSIRNGLTVEACNGMGWRNPKRSAFRKAVPQDEAQALQLLHELYGFDLV